MALTCNDCGAELAEGKSCEDYFHELLAVESQVPGATGELPHFFAVAAYNLQHPSAFIPAALTGLRRTLADILAGRAKVDDARRRASEGAEGATPVLRRAGTVLSAQDEALLATWPRQWPMTVRDVYGVPPEQYVERVRLWAMSVSNALGGA
ncbi:MAG TPA: DUF5946 family protein [Gemmatimonadaceae bacterium]|nr:DUF5946 family protein [Gemmatimonadaceae bacterium]